MSDYVKKKVSDFEESTGNVIKAKTPAADHLFHVREDCEKLKRTRH